MNELSLEEVYKEYYSKVTALVYKKVGDHSMVEDMVSEIFLKITRNFDKFDPAKASIGTWVYTVANRYITDYYRSRKVFVELPEENGETGAMPEALVIENDLDANILLEEQLEELADALEQLKEKERDLIILHYYQGLQLKEIAAMMGMSYANAKVLHRKALFKLNGLMS